jgi:4-hydroxymandelate oxidase
VVDIEALERRFESSSSQAVFDWVAKANGSLTYRWNIAAWDSIALLPRKLQGASSEPALSVTLLGQSVDTPVMLAPAGMPPNLHPEQELEVARGAADAGSLLCLSQWSSRTLEDVANAAPTVRRWFQLYISKDRPYCAELLHRAVAAGYTAVVLTVDVGSIDMPPVGTQDEDGPATQTGVYTAPPMVGRDPFDGTISLDDIAWVKQQCSLPIVVKGILRADDAINCVKAGADAIQVSNHGGRVLDTALPSAIALPPIASALEGKAEVYVDGGIRHGRDVLKALALGARAVFIGEPWMVAVSVGGASAVRRLLQGLTYELASAMNQCGLSRIADITADVLAGNQISQNTPAYVSPPSALGMS